jgi:peptidoglycan/xylan/chitin deacetylase (PgdA/CDA1 family)
VTSSIKGSLRNSVVRVGGWLKRAAGARPGKRAIALHEADDIVLFRDRLQWLKEHYEVLTVQEWLTKPVTSRTQILLSFDDGYASWADSLAATLEDMRIPALFFVSSGVVGLQGAEAVAFAKRRLRRTRELRFISLGQLRELAGHHRFQIGAHTVNHVDLGRLTESERVRREIEDDRERLRQWTGRAVRWFAYPFGGPENIAATAREQVKQLDFDAAFSLVPGTWHPLTGDRFLIGRDGLELSYSPNLWAAWLAGGYDRLYHLKAKLVPSPG